MAFYDTSRPAAGPASGTVSRVVRGVIADFAAWREARVNRAALSRLSDRELSDIGLMRADLDAMRARDLPRR